MSTTLAVGAIVGSLGSLFAAWRAHERINRGPGNETLQADVAELRERLSFQHDKIRELRAEYAQINEWRSDITLAVDEGIREVTRKENRIRATVRRAREELADRGLESPGLEAEAAELRERDGGRGEEEELPAVHAGVGGDQQGDSGGAGLMEQLFRNHLLPGSF